MTALFFIAVAFCAYTYMVFPLLLHIRAKRRPDAVQAVAARAELPTVTIVIAAHNESSNVAAKCESLAQLDYPQHKLEVVFVSDGSTDNTIALLEQYCLDRPRWHVYSYAPAAGKPTALNLGVSKASGDYLVFMDARQPVSSDSVYWLANRLQDPTVGAVSGELILGDEAGNEAANVGLYWRYEKWIRFNESRLFSTTGATGALYATRRDQYTPLFKDALLDDFDTPVTLLRDNLRTVFEPRAKVFDQAEASGFDEYRRKCRTLAGNFQSFMRHPWLFDPRKNPVWLQFISHKVFRLLVPLAMLTALLSSLFGDGLFLNVMVVLQLLFYSLGIFGLFGWNNRLAAFVKIFLQLNAATVVGAWRVLTGRAAIRWK